VWQVVQVYLSWVNSAVPVPRWTLVGFQRVTVSLDKPQQLSFTVTARQMAVWVDDKTGFSVHTGICHFHAHVRNVILSDWWHGIQSEKLGPKNGSFLFHSKNWDRIVRRCSIGSAVHGPVANGIYASLVPHPPATLSARSATRSGWRMCRSRIGLLAHNKSHSWWWDPSRRRLSPWLTGKLIMPPTDWICLDPGHITTSQAISVVIGLSAAKCCHFSHQTIVYKDHHIHGAAMHAHVCLYCTSLCCSRQLNSENCFWWKLQRTKVDKCQ